MGFIFYQNPVFIFLLESCSRQTGISKAMTFQVQLVLKGPFPCSIRMSYLLWQAFSILWLGCKLWKEWAKWERLYLGVTDSASVSSWHLFQVWRMWQVCYYISQIPGLLHITRTQVFNLSMTYSVKKYLSLIQPLQNIQNVLKWSHTLHLPSRWTWQYFLKTALWTLSLRVLASKYSEYHFLGNSMESYDLEI